MYIRMAKLMQTMIDQLNDIYNKLSEKEAEVIMDVEGKPRGCTHMRVRSLVCCLPGRPTMHSPGIWSSTRMRSWGSMWSALSWIFLSTT